MSQPLPPLRWAGGRSLKGPARVGPEVGGKTQASGSAPAALTDVEGGAEAGLTSTSDWASPSLALLPRHPGEGKGQRPRWEGVS